MGDSTKEDPEFREEESELPREPSPCEPLSEIGLQEPAYESKEKQRMAFTHRPRVLIEFLFVAFLFPVLVCWL